MPVYFRNTAYGVHLSTKHAQGHNIASTEVPKTAYVTSDCT